MPKDAIPGMKLHKSKGEFIRAAGGDVILDLGSTKLRGDRGLGGSPLQIGIQLAEVTTTRISGQGGGERHGGIHVSIWRDCEESSLGRKKGKARNSEAGQWNSDFCSIGQLGLYF